MKSVFRSPKNGNCFSNGNLQVIHPLLPLILRLISLSTDSRNYLFSQEACGTENTRFQIDNGPLMGQSTVPDFEIYGFIDLKKNRSGSSSYMSSQIPEITEPKLAASDISAGSVRVPDISPISTVFLSGAFSARRRLLTRRLPTLGLDHCRVLEAFHTEGVIS